MNSEQLTLLRNNFRQAFQDYLKQGDYMANLLRHSDEELTPERRTAIRNQQAVLTAALRRYESARQKYVEGVMGELAGLNAMGLKVQ